MELLPIKRKRMKIATGLTIVLLAVGVWAWTYDPENLNLLTGYIGVAIIPTIGFIFADTLRKSE
jgi:hypothetical protein